MGLKIRICLCWIKHFVSTLKCFSWWCYQGRPWGTSWSTTWCSPSQISSGHAEMFTQDQIDRKQTRGHVVMSTRGQTGGHVITGQILTPRGVERRGGSGGGHLARSPDLLHLHHRRLHHHQDKKCSLCQWTDLILPNPDKREQLLVFTVTLLGSPMT